MTRRFKAFSLLAGLLFAGSVLAAEHGYIASITHDELNEKLFRVDIEKINGEQPSPGVNHHAHVGKNTVTVSLVFNSSWGQAMSQTQQYIYMKDIEVDVEKGKRYYLGAKVDTAADKDAMDDGSFWEPVIAEVHD